MKRQWEIYSIDAGSSVSFLVVSSDAVNEVFAYVTVVPLVGRDDGARQVYPVEALVDDRVAMVHQIRTIRGDRLAIHRGTVDDEKVRRAVRDAMFTHFGW